MPAEVASRSFSGKSPQSPPEPRPSYSMTMVGASADCGASHLYSRLSSPMLRKPVGARLVMLCRSSLSVVKPGHDDLLSIRPVPQLEPLDLPRRRLGQGIHHVDPARIFPRADLLLDVILEHLLQARRRRAGAQHDEGLGLQQTFRIGFGHDGSFQHGGMRDQRALDLEGRDPDARDLEHVVGAAAEGIAALGIPDIFVAGAGPRPLERAAALVALVPVALAGGGRIDQELADLAVGDILSRLVDKP